MAQTPQQVRTAPSVWLIAAILVVITAIVVAGYLLLTRREMAVLFDGLRPSEASAIVAELDTQGVEYELRDGGATILVPDSQADAVRLRIAAADLPVQGLDGFELFDTSDLGLTDFAQRIKYQRAIQGELARTIMGIDGIHEARVHVSIPERSVFRGERAPAKAAVSLVTRSPDVETPATIEGIQQLVAAAIPDLAATDVAVLNSHGQIISRKAAPPAAKADSEGTPPLLTPSALLATAVRSALPGSQASIAIASTPVEGGQQSVATITVTTAAHLDEDARTRATRAIQAIQDANVQGVAANAPIVFATARPQATPAQPIEDPAPAIAMTPAALSSSQQHAPDLPSTTLADLPNDAVLFASAGVAAALGIVLLVLVTRRRGALLSRDDQKRFAERLRIGLQSQAKDTADAL